MWVAVILSDKIVLLPIAKSLSHNFHQNTGNLQHDIQGSEDYIFPSTVYSDLKYTTTKQNILQTSSAISTCCE